MPPRMPKIVCTKSGGFDQPAVEEMGQVVEVADVVALELEARAAALAELLQDVLDVREGVAEDEVAAVSRDSGCSHSYLNAL